jgi:formylmethanofuran dehydrogenase subunit B
VDGIATPAERALAIAADLLVHARRPLVYGLAQATVEAQRAAVALAERLGAAIDVAGSSAHAGASRALRTLGAVTATLGEARARAELLVFWGMDPDAVHPKFSERYLASVPKSHAPRTLAVDVGDARGPARADERVAVEADTEIELLWALRAGARGRRIESVAGTAAGWADAARALARRLTSAPYAVLFFDAEPAPARRDPLRALALTALAAEVKAPARLRVVGVRAPGNAAGAEAVLTWQTGYPSAVDFAAGYPRYGPDEYEAERLLARGEVDTVLLVGTVVPDDLSPVALAELARVPKVLVAGGAATADARVAFETLPPDETPGSTYRMDGLALRRRVERTSDLPTDEDVLRALLEAVTGAPAGAPA